MQIPKWRQVVWGSGAAGDTPLSGQSAEARPGLSNLPFLQSPPPREMGKDGNSPSLYTRICTHKLKKAPSACLDTLQLSLQCACTHVKTQISLPNTIWRLQYIYTHIYISFDHQITPQKRNFNSRIIYNSVPEKYLKLLSNFYNKI